LSAKVHPALALSIGGVVVRWQRTHLALTWRYRAGQFLRD
jgi:hypothetical protein